MSWQKEYRENVTSITGEASWTLGKIFVRIVLPLLVFAIAIGFLTGLINIASQPGKVLQKTFNADNMIYNYEWFKQQNQSVLAIADKIKQAEQTLVTFKEDAGPRKEWDFEDKTESSRLSTIVLGLQNQREDMVAAYNAKSEMANRSIFKTNDLPMRLQ